MDPRGSSHHDLDDALAIQPDVAAIDRDFDRARKRLCQPLRERYREGGRAQATVFHFDLRLAPGMHLFGLRFLHVQPAAHQVMTVPSAVATTLASEAPPEASAAAMSRAFHHRSIADRDGALRAANPAFRWPFHCSFRPRQGRRTRRLLPLIQGRSDGRQDTGGIRAEFLLDYCPHPTRRVATLSPTICPHRCRPCLRDQGA